MLCSAAFAAIGTLLGAVMPSPRAAQGAGLMLFFVMLFLSGASVPMEVMSDTMTRIGDFLPLTYGVDLLQGAWSGGAWDWAAAIVLAGIAVAAGFLQSARVPLGVRAAGCPCALLRRGLAPQSFSSSSASRFFTAACTFLSSSSP